MNNAMSTEIFGSNGQGPHGMARYGTEWRRVDPVAGSLTVPFDADEFVMVGGGGAGAEFTTAEANRLRQSGVGGFVRNDDGTETIYIGGFGGMSAGGGGRGGATP